MKKLVYLLALIATVANSNAQEHINTKGGYAAQGYDLVSYFQENPLKGSKDFTHVFQETKYKFSSEENLQLFIKEPTKYLPEYGGFCAYAVAKNGKKVSVDPKTYVITDGKLYLFYNSWGVNTLEKWNEEGADRLEKDADTKWKAILSSQ